MKNGILILLLIIAFTNCKSKKKESVKVIYDHYKHSWDTIPLFTDFKTYYPIEISNGNYIFQYCTDSTYSYEIRNVNNYSKECIDYEIDTNLEISNFYITLEHYKNIQTDRKYFILENEKFLVIRFEIDKPDTDGDLISFWNPRLGFVLYKSNSWGTIEELKSFGQKDSILLKELIHKIKQDSVFFMNNKPPKPFS